MLDPVLHEAPPPDPSALPSKRYNPTLALFLSLIFPGLGHLYLGLFRRAAWIIGFEALSLVIIAFGNGTLHGQGIFAAPILYCFAMADAYFSAREQNAEVDILLIGTNPRITAALNLLTKGFGYFYLGDRVKGVVCFVICTAVQAAILVRFNIWTSLLAISLQVAIAVDGYRVARQRLLSAHPELAVPPGSPEDQIANANPGGLPPAVATVFFITMATICLVGYGTLRAMSGKFVTSQGALEQGPAGLTYTNAAERVALTVPEDWTNPRTAHSLVMLQGTTGSSVILLDMYSMYATGSTMDADQKNMIQRHPKAAISTPDHVNVHSANTSFDVGFTNDAGREIQQRVVYHRRGIKVFMLIETWTTSAQRTELDTIEQSVSF